MKYETEAEIIIQLAAADLKLRDELIARGELGSQGYHPEMKALHERNAAELETIIDRIGYPTVTKVGKQASEAAWLIIQHSIGQPDFMRKCQQLLETAVMAQEANALGLAYLTDRILVFEEEVQLYGTQFDWDEHGQMSPQPYDDLSTVNERRRSIGLNTLEEQTAIMRANAAREQERPPLDLVARKAAMRAWQREVGWIKDDGQR